MLRHRLGGCSIAILGRMTEPTDQTRAVVTQESADRPILLKVYGPGSKEVVTVVLTPTRALDLARDLTEPAVQSIKFEQCGSGWPVSGGHPLLRPC